MSAKQCCLQYCFQTYFHHIALRVYHPVTNFNQQCTVKTTPVTLYKHVSGKKKILNKISVYQDCQITAMKSNCYKQENLQSFVDSLADLYTPVCHLTSRGYLHLVKIVSSLLVKAIDFITSTLCYSL